MVNEYKKIVLLKGLEGMQDYQFRIIKCLLRKELKLTKKMQDDYDRIQLADLMEDKFPKDAGLDKLIEVCELIEGLEDITKKLKTEKEKVQNKEKEKGKTAMTNEKQGEISTFESFFISNESSKNKPSSKTKRKQITKTEGGKKKKLTQKQTQFPEPSGTNIKKEEDCVHTPLKPPPTPRSSSTNKTPRREIVPTEPAKEEGHQKGPKQVMVLKVTEPFTYDLKEDKRMFHATVATETEFFRVKVFDTALKTKFIPRNIIAISDYFGYNGFLEIYKSSCVSDVNVNQTMVISKTLRQRANATPKISYLFSQAKGTFVNGEFVVFKKIERDEVISYGIEDDTGKMEVVVYGQLTNIKCEPGSKLRLVCFELTSTDHVWQLRSVRHSYMQVQDKGKPLNPDSVMETSLEPYF
ncbi:interferon-activable protein 203-like [Apodemus sylvaticus]|uniref:interferon-activable protein 203-like n=1 Tax=Apodemus sylvaticus TaxID=10129 RepID=UPI002242AB17|nr:interferon-activable protein 203-like [Apodemus sylvaticus]